MSKQIQFEGLIFFPKGKHEELNLQEAVLDQDNFQYLYDEMDQSFKRGPQFKVTLNAGGKKEALTVGYNRVGKSAGILCWTHETNGQIDWMHGITVLLTRINKDDDQKAIDMVRSAEALKVIEPGSFDIPLTKREPMAVTFFADIRSANQPVINTMIRVASAAFFNQYGIGDKTLN